MFTKHDEWFAHFIENLHDDEPIFILVGRDLMAPSVIEHWAAKRITAVAMGDRPQSDQPQVESAMMCAKEMRKFRLELVSKSLQKLPIFEYANETQK